MNEFFSAEDLQIFNAFSESDVFYGNFELVRNANHYPTFSRTIKLGDCHGSDVCRSR